MIGATATTRPARQRLMPHTLAGREIAVVLSRPRALVIKVALPLALAVVLLAGHAPTFWAGMLLTVLAGMVGAVGSAVTVSRARDAGFLTRLSATPGSRPRLMVSWTLAAAAVDSVQMLPVAVAAVVSGATGAVEILTLIAALAGTLVVTNVLGVLITLAAATAAEVLLDAVVVLAPLLYLGGLFTGVPATGWRAVAAAIDPFAHLQSAFIAALGGSPTYPPGVDLAATAAVAVAALAVLGLLARRVLERG